MGLHSDFKGNSRKNENAEKEENRCRVDEFVRIGDKRNEEEVNWVQVEATGANGAN
jgi:hypothetical protein